MLNFEENFLFEKCSFKEYTPSLLEGCSPFDCGHKDLNSFFKDDAFKFHEELLGKTHCFTLDNDPTIIVCAFTISNDSVKASDLPGSRRKKVTKLVPREKALRNYPAVLIGRLGVNVNYKGTTVSRELMQFIKSWFIDPENKTGCRYIVVDSYNEPIPLHYYTKNGFETIFSTEDQEKEYLKIAQDQRLKTRLMYFDLIVLRAVTT
ncbi:GNAT family N-acetyltransferase [Mucilaginibacter sp. OK283]|uniref:GNAT family N-acetyltransferase n=1 Tax=Mucilaginibacter sp. OK283 TaxID=1881049 RepID=UPI0008C8286B|nr:GNAT family N-acetyltransferase [Mucilaginibacter sp. OK283]SEO60539.1 hypothetical protein SAMN05428947_10398 [Mucilaginibacter sp. OK283]